MHASFTFIVAHITCASEGLILLSSRAVIRARRALHGSVSYKSYNSLLSCGTGSILFSGCCAIIFLDCFIFI